MHDDDPTRVVMSRVPKPTRAPRPPHPRPVRWTAAICGLTIAAVAGAGGATIWQHHHAETGAAEVCAAAAAAFWRVDVPHAMQDAVTAAELRAATDTTPAISSGGGAGVVSPGTPTATDPALTVAYTLYAERITTDQGALWSRCAVLDHRPR